MLQNHLCQRFLLYQPLWCLRKKCSGKCREICHSDQSMDLAFTVTHQEVKSDCIQINLDEETLKRRIRFDMAGRLEVTVDNQRHRNEAIPLELNVERYGRSHTDETRHLELSADNERCKKTLSNSCTDIRFDCSAQESSRLDSPSQYYVDFDEVAAVRRLTESASPSDFEFCNDSFEQSRHSSTACFDACIDANERTPFNNSSYSVDVDCDVTERPVNNSTYCMKHDNGNCIDVSSDTFERPVNNNAYCFEYDNEAVDRRSSVSSKHSNADLGNGNPDHLDNYEDAHERRPLKQKTNSAEPDVSTLEGEQPNSPIYYELDLDAGVIFGWRDSSGGSHHSADERRELRGRSSRVTDHGVRHDCLVCFESRTTVIRRKCCKFPVCHSCLETYYATKVSVASVHVQCIGSGCNKYVSQAEIMSYLTDDLQDRYLRLLVDANRDPRRKTCPRCSHITEVDPEMLKGQGNQKYGLRCLCSVCNLIWCFKCQAPWHEPLSCREYLHGDRQFKAWTKQQLEGQANAQKCPKCKVYIQRNGGCDHMTCLRCSTDFCYQCGEKYRKMKFVGDHRSRYSILGCKYRYKPNSPVKRRLVRGSIFGGKLLAAPIVGGLALGAGAVALGLGLVVLPFYGGYKLHKLVKQRRMEKEDKTMERRWREFVVREFAGDAVEEDRSTTSSDYDPFEFDEFDQMHYYGADNDDYSMEIYSLATSVNEESEEHQNNPSPLLQSGCEISSEANTFDVDLTDLGALNSNSLDLPADQKIVDSNHDDTAVVVARTGVRIPRRFCRTNFIESTGLGMNKDAGSSQSGRQKNLNRSRDVAETRDREIVQPYDEVTHL